MGGEPPRNLPFSVRLHQCTIYDPDVLLVFNLGFEVAPSDAGLIEAFGREGNFWPTIEELAGGDIEAYARLPLREKLRKLTRNFLDGIRSRPLTQEILAWEMVERNELTVELEVIRETRMMHFYEMFFPPDSYGVDLAAISAIIGGAISYLVTRSRKIQWYGGVDLQSEDGWQRLVQAVDSIVDGVLAGSTG